MIINQTAAGTMRIVIRLTVPRASDDRFACEFGIDTRTAGGEATDFGSTCKQFGLGKKLVCHILHQNAFDIPSPPQPPTPNPQPQPQPQPQPPNRHPTAYLGSIGRWVLRWWWRSKCRQGGSTTCFGSTPFQWPHSRCWRGKVLDKRTKGWEVK